MSIIITVDQKGARVDAIDKILEENVRTKYPEASIRVSRYDPPETRPARFDEAMKKVSEAKEECENLKSELEDWQGNIPESLQGSEKMTELEEAVDQLDEVISALESAEGIKVDFPSMM